MISLAPCHRCGREHESVEIAGMIQHRCPSCGPLCPAHDRSCETDKFFGYYCPDCQAGKPNVLTRAWLENVLERAQSTMESVCEVERVAGTRAWTEALVKARVFRSAVEVAIEEFKQRGKK